MRPSPLLSDVLDAIARGDRQSFAELYTATSPKLFGVIVRIVRQRELAEEVLQEAYLTIWQKAASFDASKGSAIAWMCTIARNRALDHVRRRAVPIAATPVEDIDAVDPGKSPLGHLVSSQDLSRLERCLDELDDRHAEAIRMAYLEGASRESLAERFGAPVGTVKTWLRRNLIKLKDCLGDE